ncbi:MAG: hypothetical protein AAFO94_19860, partial [Bacteroidota bacterium]
MKNVILMLAIGLFLVGCGSSDTAEVNSSAAIEYPEALEKVFATHGGLDQWQQMKTLRYTIDRPIGPEKHM